MTTPVVQLAWDVGADHSIPLPQYATEGAAGADIRANLPPESRADGLTLNTLERLVVPTGLRMEIPAGFEVQLRPRSGMALDYGVTICNSPGTIDADFRGQVGVLLVNLSANRFTVRHGDRIAQMVVSPVAGAEFSVSEILDSTARDAAGFGSTGLR